MRSFLVLEGSGEMIARRNGHLDDGDGKRVEIARTSTRLSRNQIDVVSASSALRAEMAATAFVRFVGRRITLRRGIAPHACAGSVSRTG